MTLESGVTVVCAIVLEYVFDESSEKLVPSILKRLRLNRDSFSLMLLIRTSTTLIIDWLDVDVGDELSGFLFIFLLLLLLS